MHKVELVDGMINGFLCHPTNPSPIHLGPYAARRREVARIRVELLEPVNPVQSFSDLCPLFHIPGGSVRGERANFNFFQFSKFSKCSKIFEIFKNFQKSFKNDPLMKIWSQMEITITLPRDADTQQK